MLTQEQIDFFKANGYVNGGRVLSRPEERWPMIADILIDIYERVTSAMRPIVSPILARIMRSELDRRKVHTDWLAQVKAEADAHIASVSSEIEGMRSEIERMRIEMALMDLCREHNLDPVPVIAGLADHCRLDPFEILDSYGVPTSFDRAVKVLGGGDDFQ